MAEDRSPATIAWLWTIEYLATLKDFDSSLLNELVESAPEDVRKAANEIFQSPLPTKCSLELIKEQLVGGLISDDLLKKRSGIFTEGVNSDGSKVAEGESILNEISGEQLNQQPATAEVDDHSVRIGDGDLNVQTAELIDVDSVLLETSDPNAGMVDNTQQPSTDKKELAVETGGGDNLQETKSIEEEEEEGDDGDVVLMEIPDANVNDRVQSNNQPSTCETQHAVETGCEDINLQGTEPTPDDDIVLLDAPVANANGELDNSHQQPSTGGTEHIVETSGTNRDGSARKEGSNTDADDSVRNCQQPSNAKLDHPSENGAHANNDQVKSGRNKLTESNHDGSISAKASDAYAYNQTQNHEASSNREREHHHPERSSNENGEERASTSRKRTMSDYLEARQSSVPVDASNFVESNLCGRCHRPGALLECGSANCPMMIHRDCLGFDASTVEARDFYCPLCAHIRAVAELHEAQRRAALAQKNLTLFVDLSMRSCENNSDLGVFRK